MSTTEGQMLPAPEQPPASPGVGLDQPDCGTRVSDVFWLGPASAKPARPECGFAEIYLLKDMSQHLRYRADSRWRRRRLARAATRRTTASGCNTASNEWRVLEIRDGGIDVMNACGDQETLGIAGEPPPKPAPGPPPDTSIEVEDSRFGPGTVETWEGCKRVRFTPRKAGETREYELEVLTRRDLPGRGLKVYIPVDGEKIQYAPMDLAGMLRVYLLGDKCGQPLPPPSPSQSRCPA